MDPQMTTADPAQTQSTGNGQQTLPPSMQQPSSVSSSPASNSGVSGSSSTSGITSTGNPALADAGVSSAQQQATFRDILRGQYGVDLSSYQSDHEALQHLLGTYRQAQDLQGLARLGQEFLPHRERYNAWLQEQRAAEQAKQQAQQAWWKKPEYDPSWMNKLTRDPQTGEVRPIPGADPGLVSKYMAWVEHQRGFLDKFSQDPMEAIGPGVKEIASQVAQQLIQQHLGGYQEQVSAKSLVSNLPWLYQQDEQGNTYQDPRTGRPVLSQMGQRYAGYVAQAEQMGLQGVQAQHNYAVGMAQRDFLLTQFASNQQSQQAQSQGEAAKQQFLQSAAQHRPNVASAQANGANGAPVNPAGLNNQRSLQDYMMKAMAANGYQPGQTIDMGR